MSYSVRDNAPSSIATASIRRPYLLLLVAITLAVHVLAWRTVNADFAGDELRYLGQAKRIVEGTPLYPTGLIKNPPLYPALLAGLLELGVPQSALKLVSIGFVTGAAVLLFSMLGRVCTPAWAFALSCLFVLYPPMVMLGSRLLTEPPGALLLLVACRLLFDVHDFGRPGLRRLLGLSLVLAALALLKPLFGYALAAAIGIVALLYALRAWDLRPFYRWVGGACALALVLCTPYLCYVHSLTGDRFGWGTTAGEHLYWMSIGGEDVWGSWVASDEMEDIDFLVDNGYAAEVRLAATMSGPDAQRYYARLGAERLREHPEHFVRNLLANATRVLFNYPYSFRPQSLYTYGYLLPNMLMYPALALSVALLPVARRRQHPGLASALLFGMVYLGGNVLVGSTGRQGVVLIGVILLWLAAQVRSLIDAGVIVPQGAPGARTAGGKRR